MVVFKVFEEFFAAAERLYLAKPTKTRYSIKYRHAEGKLELKVTDDVVCLKYRSDQAQDVKNVERLNQLFLRHMTHSEATPTPAAAATNTPPASPAPAAASAPAPTAAKGKKS